MEESADGVEERQQAWRGKKRGLPRHTELARVTAIASIAWSEVDNHGQREGGTGEGNGHLSPTSSTPPSDLKYQQGQELPNPLVVEPRPPSSPHTSRCILLTLAIASSKPSAAVEVSRSIVTSRLYHAGAHLHLATLIGHRLPSQASTGKYFPVGHPSQIAPGQARLTSEFFGYRPSKNKLQLVDMSILFILGRAHLHLAVLIGHRLSSQTNTSFFCTLCPHSSAHGKYIPVGHPTSEFFVDRLLEKKLQLVDMSIY
uniref:Uncharacterized protein n=1 Tax=Oryza glumipatula TaxID=40148 RepID=A0A0E0AAZ4_9ORYZ